MRLGGCGTEGDRALADKGVHVKSAGKNRKVHHGEADIRARQRRWGNGGIH